MYEIGIVVLLLIAIAMIALILVQQGKGAGMGASFGAGASNTVFGSVGSGNFLTRSTWTLIILFFGVCLFFVYKKDIQRYTWFLLAALAMIPLAYIASESGWIVAEIGRQPWTIQDLLPVNAAVSDIEAGSVATTFFIFLALFTTMLAVEINIMVKQIKKGPEYEKVDTNTL